MIRPSTQSFRILALIMGCCWSSLVHGQQWQWAIQNQSNNFANTPVIMQAEDGSLLAFSHFDGPGLVQFNQWSFPSGANLMIHIQPDGIIDTIQIIGAGLTIEEVFPSQDGSNELFLMGNYQNGATVGTINLPPTTAQMNAFAARIDRQGNVKWSKTLTLSAGVAALFHGFGMDQESSLYMVGIHADTLFYAGDTLVQTNMVGSSFLAKMDSSGNEVWIRGMNSPTWVLASCLVVNESDQIFVGGSMAGNTSFDFLPINNLGGNEQRFFMVSYDKNGQGLWGVQSQSSPSTYVRSNRMAVDPIGGAVYMAGHFSQGDLSVGNDTVSSVAYEIFLVSYFPDGSFQRIEHITGAGNEFPSALNVGPDRGVFLSGNYSSGISIDTFQQSSSGLFVMKWSHDGQPLWMGSAKGPGLNISSLVIDPDGQLFGTGALLADTLLLGNDTLAKPGSLFLTQLKDTVFDPPNSTLVQGRIWAETDLNCLYDGDSTHLTQWIVKAEPGPYFAATAADGTYTLNLDTGTYTIQQALPSFLDQFSSPLCPPPGTAYTLSIDPAAPDTSGFDFVNEYLSCYLLSARVANTRRRICFENLTRVEYCNLGTDSAFNVQIHLQYSPEVSLQSASHPFIQSGPQHYRFDIGTLAPFSCDAITLTDFVDCSALSQIGENSCIEVWITPENICPPPDTNWSLASLSLEGNCTGADTAEFWVRNEGQGAMDDSVAYQLYLNDTLVHQANLWLDVVDSIRLRVPTGGKTAHLRVDQAPHHPRQDWIARTVDACGRTVGFPFSTQFSSSFPQSDLRDLNFMRHCEPLAASYDPNDKQATPKGKTEENLIPPNSYLNYRIRFQNTGNDTAFKVVLIDTLPEWVDPSTLRMEGASHPYSYSLRGIGRPVMEIVFDPIILPDSGTNEPESNGFASFSFRIAAHTPLETPLENFADIYFDFNPPIRTDTVHHLLSNRMPSSPDPGIVEERCFFSPPAVQLLGSDSLLCELVGEIYKWYKDGIALPDSSQVIPISGPGLYTVQVQKGRCVSEVSSAYPVTSTGIYPGLSFDEISISPNPSEGLLQVRLHPMPLPESKIRVLDVYGRVVWQQSWQALPGQDEKQLELQALASGLYYLSIDGQVAAKLLRK